jgi:hypothetical protein
MLVLNLDDLAREEPESERVDIGMSHALLSARRDRVERPVIPKPGHKSKKRVA